VLFGMGFAIYFYRAPLYSASTSLVEKFLNQEGIADKASAVHSLPEFLQTLVPNQDNSSTARTQIIPDTAQSYFYTVELKDGGKIEGRTINIEKASITIIDDRGIKIQIPHQHVSRITKIRN
jgi:hypothetical protein